MNQRDETNHYRNPKSHINQYKDNQRRHKSQCSITQSEVSNQYKKLNRQTLNSQDKTEAKINKQNKKRDRGNTE